MTSASQVAQWLRVHLLMQEMQVRSLGQEDPVEKEMAAHSSTLAWGIPRAEEPGGYSPHMLTHTVRADSCRMCAQGRCCVAHFPHPNP